jgi:hypothetical protein
MSTCQSKWIEVSRWPVDYVWTHLYIRDMETIKPPMCDKFVLERVSTKVKLRGHLFNDTPKEQDYIICSWFSNVATATIDNRLVNH